VRRRFLGAIGGVVAFALWATPAAAFAPPPEARAWLGDWHTNQGEVIFKTVYGCQPNNDGTGNSHCFLDGQWHQPVDTTGFGGTRVAAGWKAIQGGVLLGPKYKGEAWQGCFHVPGDGTTPAGQRCSPWQDGVVSIDRFGDRFTEGFWKACALSEICTDHHPIRGKKVGSDTCAPAGDPLLAHAACAEGKKLLIFGLGDSLSSGEGNPDVPKRGTFSRARWENYQCDRSNLSYQAQVVAKLRSDDPSADITFHHLACSGASIDQGMLGGFNGVNGGSELPAQVDQARALAKDRKADAVLLTMGINDLRFGDVLGFCATTGENDYCPTREYRDGMTLREWVAHSLGQLRVRYTKLAQRLDPLVEPGRVFIMEYPDELSTSASARCNSLFIYRNPVTGSIYQLRRLEVLWLYKYFYSPLNAAVARAARENHWHLITPPPLFSDHGYCTANHWVVQYNESYANQGNKNGTMHPNGIGTTQVVDRVFPIVKAALAP
jgi:lysophospholipase L1-like esterase